MRATRWLCGRRPAPARRGRRGPDGRVHAGSRRPGGRASGRGRSAGTPRRRSSPPRRSPTCSRPRRASRSSSSARADRAVLRRFMQEIDAKRVLADVLTVSDTAEVNGLAKRDLLVPFRPKNFDKIPDAVKDPKGQHIAQRRESRRHHHADRQGPRAPQELAGPDRSRSTRAQLVMPDPSYTAIQLMVVGTLSRKYGWEFYQKLARQRRHDRAGAPAGLGSADPGRAADRRRGRRPVRVAGSEGRAQDPDRHPDRRGVRGRGAHRGHQGLAASQRGEGLRRVHDRRRGPEAVPGRGHLRGAGGRAAAARQPAAGSGEARGPSTTTRSRRRRRT